MYIFTFISVQEKFSMEIHLKIFIMYLGKFPNQIIDMQVLTSTYVYG